MAVLHVWKFWFSTFLKWNRMSESFMSRSTALGFFPFISERFKPYAAIAKGLLLLLVYEGYKEQERNISRKEIMQSSLSFPHARRGLNFAPKPNPTTTHPPFPKSPLLFFSNPTNSSSPSHQLRLTSLSQPHPPRNEPLFTTPTESISTRRRTRLVSFVAPLHSRIPLNGKSHGSRSFRGWIEVVGEALSTAFPVWVALGCLLGLIRPSSFNWVQPKWTVLGITVTMLGMGMTLTFDDLCKALAMPKELLAGFVLQYTVMPLLGFAVSKLLKLPSYYAAGLILVGCCPCGTSSNIVTYIARGNVALSVLMTAASTLSAVAITPFLTAKLAGQFVAVDAVGLLVSTLQVVLLPVLGGAFLNQYFQGLVKLVSPVMPTIAVVTVATLCGKAIAQSASAILASGQQVVLAAALLHTLGFFFGYILSRMLGFDVSSSRSISFEVGVKNSVLGVVLASQHLGNPLTAVPCAISSVCSSIFGSVLAGIWRHTPPIKMNP